MEEGTKLDLQFIRHERGQNSPHAVMFRAAQVREYLEPRQDGYVEATLHLAWAYGQLGRFEEARALFEAMIDRYPDTSSLHHAMALCDYALLLHSRGLTDKANPYVRRVLNLAASTGDSQIHALVAAATAEIVAEPATD